MEGLKKRESLFLITPRMRLMCDYFFVIWEQMEYRLLAKEPASVRRYAHKSGIIEIVTEKDFAGATFLYTDNVDFRNMRIQCWLRHTLRDLIIERANIILPRRLHDLEKQKNLFAGRVNVNKLRKGVLGQCKYVSKEITLSPLILLYPTELIDSIILHEMAHLKYPHHRKSFWNFLTTLLGEDSKEQKKLLDMAISKNMVYQEWLFNGR